MRNSILLCVALMSVSALAQASSGSIRFSGRIAEPGCTTNLSQGELSLAACPPSAKGSTVAVTALADGRQGQKLSVSASAMRAGDIAFSERYSVQAAKQQPLQGAYLVVVDYL
jgi:type 1 fimbria pilin